MNSKASFSIQQVVFVIVGLISLIILFVFISSVMESAKLENAQLACETPFSKASSSSLFFTSDGDNFKDSFWKITSNVCSSFSTTIDEGESLKSSSYLQRCWDMTGGDSDFLPNAYEGGVCVYCGDLEIETGDYQIFREELASNLQREEYESLFETNKVTSLNYLLLDPNSFSLNLNDNNEIGVVVYSYKGEFTSIEDIKNSGISFLVGAFETIGAGGIAKESFDRLESFQKTQKGIAFVEMGNSGPQVDGKPVSEALNCEMIIPENNIEY